MRLSGRFTLLDSAPDGDSIHFIPDQPQALQSLGAAGRTADTVSQQTFAITQVQSLGAAGGTAGRRPGQQKAGGALRWSPRGAISLRLEGIDALETHYLGNGGLGVLRQPPPWPERAAQALVTFLGFEQVVRGPDERVVSTVPAATRGAIQLERVDRYGRAVAYAFRGNIQGAGFGSLTPAVLASSANGHLLQQGLAYPVLYQDMAHTTLRWLYDHTRKARAAGRGLWPQDLTHSGFTVHSVQDLAQRAVIWPKLYRRLVDQMGAAPHNPLESLADALEARVGLVLLWREGVNVCFADLLEIDPHARSVRLLVPPEEIAFAGDS